MRGGEAAIVDTGTASDAAPIDTALGELGVGWEDVSDVVATHNHRDHIGGFPAVAEQAVHATLGIGEADIDPVASVGDVVGLVDGDNVFGMTVIATPGHTPGHISIHDHDLGVLFTGDALNGGEVLDGEEGTVAGPNTSFTPDMPTALESIRRFEDLEFDAIAFGHGTPIENGAKAELQRYLDSL
ncbi:MAG: MBL fold metallo-hydrolase [Acidimicrobiia bacterium]|nr:MBL fold metallo-hydrolase [Acidimicrobiia bacterium]